MKKIIIVIMLLLCASLVQAATLVDSEDFEDYAASVFNGGDGKWNCTVLGEYPGCTSTAWGGGGGFATHSIITLGGNSYLFMSAINGTDALGGLRTRLVWNLTDGTALADENHSFFMDFRIDDYDNSQLSGGNLNNLFFTWEWKDTATNWGDEWLGATLDTNEATHRQFRFRYDSGLQRATGDSCALNESIWYNMRWHLNSNGTHIDNITLYQNDVLCAVNNSPDVNIDDSKFPITELSFEVNTHAQIQIDNLAYYEGYQESHVVLDCTTNCTTWSIPYYLKEDFLGNLDDCLWSTTEQVCYNDTLIRTSDQVYYSILKENDIVRDTANRFSTVSFDLKPSDILSTGWVAVSLYDEDFQRFIQFLIGENGTLYNNDAGSVVEAHSNVSTSTLTEVNLHIDFSDDDYDLYYDDAVVASSLGFSENLLNIDNLNYVRVSSSDAGYEIDNLQIYASDQNNNILLPDDTLDVAIEYNKSVCGLFLNERIPCTLDSDCEFDSCNVNGYCNRFDMRYCDENNHKRGNYCMIAGVTNCGLSNLSTIILDNFLLFLVFIIMLAGAVYAVMLIRNA